MVLKSFLYSFSSYLPVIRRHLQITSFSADIICMCTFRIFALKYGAKSTHIAVCDTRKGIFDILSSFLFCGRCYLWRSHTAPTLPDRSCFCILHWSRAVPSRHWCMARKMHQQNRRLIVTAIAEIAGSPALVQAFLYYADSFFSCGVFDQYAFYFHDFLHKFLF